VVADGEELGERNVRAGQVITTDDAVT
jgi:hypothetical protein